MCKVAVVGNAASYVSIAIDGKAVSTDGVYEAAYGATLTVTVTGKASSSWSLYIRLNGTTVESETGVESITYSMAVTSTTAIARIVSTSGGKSSVYAKIVTE